MASPTLISSGKGGASGATSPTLSAGVITVGSTVLAFASDVDGNSLSVSGSSGGAYTLVGQVGGTNPRARVFKRENHPGGAETLTFTFGAAADPALSFEQWSPCTVDTASLVTNAAGTTPWSTTSNALASVNSTVILVATSDGGGTVTYSESTGFTKDQEQSDGNLYWTHSTFYKAVSATTAVTSSLTIAAGIALGTAPKRIIFALTATGGAGASVAPVGIASAAAIGAPGVRASLAPAGISTASALGSPGAGAGVAPAGVGSAAAYGSPTVSPTIQVQPAGIASAAAIGAPALGAEVATQGVSSVVVLGVPGLDARLAPAGLATDQTFGLPEIELTSGILPDGIASAAAYGLPALGAALGPLGIASAQAFGAPSVLGTHEILPLGLASGAAYGMPVLYNPDDTGPSDWIHWTEPGDSRRYTVPGDSRTFKITGDSRNWSMTP